MADINLTGDIYLKNVSDELNDPVATSIRIYDDITSLIQNTGRTERYGQIEYVIVPDNTESKIDNYIAFVSFKNTAIHEEVVRFLQNFHFLGKKVSVQINTKNIPTPAKRRDNKRRFETSLAKRSLTIRDKQSSSNKRKLVDSSLEESDPRPKLSKKVVQTNDEDTNDSFKSIILIKEEDTANEEQTMSELNKQIEELKCENAELKRELLFKKQGELDAKTELNLYKLNLENTKNERDALLREREVAAKLASTLHALYNKKDTSNEGQQKQ